MARCEYARPYQPEVRVMATRTPPVLPGSRVFGADRTARTEIWCPWCEQVHQHGLIAGRENRAPHCVAHSRSPFACTGYDIVVDEAEPTRTVVPPRPLGLPWRLHEAMTGAKTALRGVVLRHILGRGRAPTGDVEQRTDTGQLQLSADNAWRIEPRGRRAIVGRGLLALAAMLFGISPGVVAVRVLEATTGDVLDEEAAFGVQRAIEAWHARGGQPRAERG